MPCDIYIKLNSCYYVYISVFVLSVSFIIHILNITFQLFSNSFFVLIHYFSKNCNISYIFSYIYYITVLKRSYFIFAYAIGIMLF